ncbi:MAG: hypothetical protein D8M57_05755 [Candidatus Scalindua sp. AMX11]|nr:MAG: hypothetical protein DWQ00_02120 [Candidatus Scalindua sp.]NOG82843.1 hypothetical protein [Planctomycetota bacterium]RZV86190.1 MAG: hypothetical protein EX341_07425 [Candidatus Scalindua sp. SCAELEC01]TDE65810.1 MAG: hypothetical protein D8M57_05755 [Candidatus Scalindua sp. AMX11]GJQ58315.1 MAG: hypothetical protein SCALA701_11160 [Candidatus Scalindua sp.]
MEKLSSFLVIVLLVCFLMQVNGSRNVVAKPYSEHSVPAKSGLLVGSVLSSAVYFPFKLAYAVLGGVTSGLTYGITLGREAEAANNIAISSFYGDWYIHPNILTSEEELNFSGPDDVSP